MKSEPTNTPAQRLAYVTPQLEAFDAVLAGSGTQLRSFENSTEGAAYFVIS